MAHGVENSVVSSAARTLTKNPLRLIPHTANSIVTTVSCLLSLSNLLSSSSSSFRPNNELQLSLQGVLDLAEPLITQITPESDLQSILTERVVRSRVPNGEFGDSFDYLGLFLDSAETLALLGLGLSRSSSTKSRKPAKLNRTNSISTFSSSARPLSRSALLNTFTTSSYIYLTKFYSEKHLHLIPGLYISTSSVVRAVWDLYYSFGSTTQFEDTVSAVNRTTTEILVAFVRKNKVKGIDPKLYGQVNSEHFCAIRHIIKAVHHRIREITNGDQDSASITAFFQEVGELLLQLEQYSVRVAWESGAIRDLVFDRIRFVAHILGSFNIRTARIVLSHLYSVLASDDPAVLARFLLILNRVLDSHSDPTFVRDLRRELQYTPVCVNLSSQRVNAITSGRIETPSNKMGKSRQATPPADWERRPLDGLTIVQLQRILDDNDIEYNRKDKKRVLVNLVKKHCMSGRSKGKDKGKAKAFAHTDALIDETISENDSNMDSAGESGMPGAFQPDQTTNEASGESDDPIALTPTKKHRKEASNVGARDRGKASSKAEQVKKAAGRKEGSKRNRRAEDDGPDSASENNASESSDAETDSEDDETGPPSDTSSDNRRHIDGDDSDESADSEEESDDETNGGTTSGSDSSNDVIESIEQPRMRTLAQIDKAMGNKSSTSLLSGGKIVGWNWIGQNTRVCVEFKIGNVYTGRVKSGRHYDFEKSYETNIAVQTRFLAGKRTRGDARMIKPDIDPKRIGLGTIYWDDLGAKDPISVLHPSKVGEFPWTYIDAKIPGVSGTLKVARRFLPHLLQRPESWVHYFLYKTARQQERRFEQAFKKKKRSSAEVIEISDSEEEVTPRDTRTRRASSAQKRTPSARAHTYNQESDASSEPNGPGRSRKDTPVKRRSREATFDSGYDSPHDDRYLMSGANPAAKKHRSQRSRTSNSSDEDPTPSSNNSERRSKSRSRLSSRDMSTRDESLMEDEEDDQSHRGSRRREESGRRSRSDESGRRGESNSASRSKSTSSRRSRDAQTPEDEDGPEHRSEQPRRNSNKPKSAMKQPRRSRSESSVHFE